MIILRLLLLCYFQGMRPIVWRSIRRFQLNLIPFHSMILVSGEIDFVLGLNLPPTDASLAVLIEGAQPHRRKLPKTLRWERLKHNQCGGVTTGNFWFGVSPNICLRPGKLHSTRYLVNVTPPAAKTYQQEHLAPLSLLTSHEAITIENTICSLGLLPLEDPTKQIIAPSVFSKTEVG